jgi:hypothetical protein
MKLLSVMSRAVGEILATESVLRNSSSSAYLNAK